MTSRASLTIVLGVMLGGCMPVGPPGGQPDGGEDPIGGCEHAPTPQLPTLFGCTGPDADGWNNDAKPDGAGPCPAPPAGGCTQVVIGRLSDTRDYINCPGYEVLNRTDWTLEMNDNFVACAADGRIGTCEPRIVVVSDRASIPDLTPDNSNSTVTSREVCQFANLGCQVVLADATSLGSVNCDVTIDEPQDPAQGDGSALCGNGVIDVGEQCDPAGVACGEGYLGCNAECQCECPVYQPQEDGCIEGFYFAGGGQGTGVCEQEECPEGAGRTFTLECCCNCWPGTEHLVNVYDPCRTNFLLRCE